jgi:tRNA-dihydrouridine synthase
MEQKKVFINSIQDDTDFAREVKKSLEDAEIEVILSAPQVTLEGIPSLVKIEEVIEQSGVMLVILSEQAARDPLLISNTQLWFELAGKRQALLFCRKEEVKNDQSIALYYARAVQVGAQKNEDVTSAKTVEAARRMLGLEKSQGVIHKRLLKKSAAWLAGGLAVLTLAAEF